MTAIGQTHVANVPLADSPSGVAVDAPLGRVFVAIGSGVEVVSESTRKPLAVFPVTRAGNIAAVAVNPISSKLYVAAGNAGLYVVSALTYKTLAHVNVVANSVVINQFTHKIYVSNFSGQLYVIDGFSLNIVKTLSIPGLMNLALNPITNRIYGAQELFPGKVAVIDGKSDKLITSMTSGGALSFNVAVDELRNLIYSADELGTVSVFNGATNQLKATVKVSGQPAGISVDSITRKILVTNGSDLEIIDGNTNKRIGNLPLGTSPLYTAYDPYRGLLFASNTGEALGFPQFAETLSVVKTY